MWRTNTGSSGGRAFSQDRPFARPSVNRPGVYRRPAQWLRFRLTFLNFIVITLTLSVFAIGPVIFATWRLSKQEEKEEESRRRAKDEFLADGNKPLVNSEVCGRLRKPPWVCAHGGDTSRAPPNTIAAFDLALQAGVDCVEVDASRTADGVLVALHDRDLQGFTTLPGLRVGHLTLQQLQQYDVGLGFPPDFAGLTVPTVEEALQMLTGRVKQVTVDIKVGPPHYEGNLAADVISVVGRAGCRDCLAWAKHDSIVRDLKSLSPSIRAGYIVMNDSATGTVGALLRMDAPEVVAVHYGLATRELVAQAHRGGKEVQVWTVNDKAAMRQMVENGVDAIVTNHPRQLQEVIEQHLRLCRASGYAVQ